VTHKSIVTMCVYDYGLTPHFLVHAGHEFVINLKRMTEFFSHTV
jgi:hypothetical protein